jgi:hypothetical protein
MKPRCGYAIALAVLCGLLQTTRAEDNPYQEFLRRLPDTTNVLIVADVPALKKAIGVAPDRSLIAGEVTTVPPLAERFVLGSQIDLSERKHLWSIAMAQLAGKMTIQDVAKAENEEVDNFAGYSIVPTPRNAYFVEIEKNVLAVRTPADRQQLKQWLTHQKTNPVASLRPYLLKVGNPERGVLMVMAIDVSDSLDPRAIHRAIMNSDVMATRKQPDYKGVEYTICHADGMTLTLQPGKPLLGTLTVDFDADTQPIVYFAKRLILEVLQKTNLYVPDFDTWETINRSRSISLRGNLSVNALRKICALIKTPAPPPQAAEMTSYSSLNPEERAVVSSKRYFKTVTGLLDDLKKDKTRGTKQLAGWYDKYADEIDKLPVLDVDPQLVDFSASIAQNFRAMASSLNGISLTSGYLQQTKVEGQTYMGTGYNSYYGGWNDVMMGSRGVSNYHQVYMAQDALVRQGAQGRVKLWEMIDNETANVRRQMTAKYKVEF